MKKFSEMNGTEKIAYKNVKAAFNWEVGGWYNCYQDGYEEDIPDTLEEAKEIIYEEAMNNAYGVGYCGSGKAPKEMRFAGSAFIKEVIDRLFAKDEDAAELAEIKGW